VISRFVQEPRQLHLIAAKRILRYLKGTAGVGILFPKEKFDLRLVGYSNSNSDWCGDKDDRKSSIGYIFFLEEHLRAPKRSM